MNPERPAPAPRPARSAAPSGLALSLALLASLASGCEPGRTSATARDAGPDAGRDAGPDVTPDADVPDGGDAGPMGCVAEAFAALPTDHDPWGEGDPSICDDPVFAPGTCTRDTDCDGRTFAEDGIECPPGLCTCIPGGCGLEGRYCETKGRPCTTNAQCGGGTVSVCERVGERGYCRSANPGPFPCRGNWDCVPGFECEPTSGPPTSNPLDCFNGARVCDCVDRRLPCRVDAEGLGGVCPPGFTCQQVGGASRPFCTPPRACDDDADCGTESLGCLGHTGGPFPDGVCLPPNGSCGPSPLDCSPEVDDPIEGDACTVDVRTGQSVCGWDGPCDLAAPACGPGLDCSDTLHVSAAAWCHPTAGCQSDAECRPGARCLWLACNPPADRAALEAAAPEAECVCFDPAGAGGLGGASPCEGRAVP